jgi:hypothetical protein
VKGVANGSEGADVSALVWIGSFSTEPTGNGKDDIELQCP